MEFHKDVDARGLNCPLPILRAKKALNDMASGDVLRVVATDPGSVRDFNAFARQTGNALVAHTGEQGGTAAGSRCFQQSHRYRPAQAGCKATTGNVSPFTTISIEYDSAFPYRNFTCHRQAHPYPFRPLAPLGHQCHTTGKSRVLFMAQPAQTGFDGGNGFAEFMAV